MINLNIRNFSGYLVASAIRGPDSNAYSAMKLKHITTSVLRYFIGVSPDIGADVLNPLEAENTWNNCTLDLQEAIKRFWRDNQHFSEHFMIAMEQLPHIIPMTKEYIDYMRWIKNVLDS